MSLPSEEDLWSRIMHDLHADFWPKTKTGVQGEGSILFEYFLDESWHHFRVQSKRLLLLGKKNALVALIIDTLLRDDKAGQLSKYKCLPLLLAEIADVKPESFERISSKKQRLLLAEASEDIGRTASSLSDQLVSDLLAEMLAKYSAGTKSARTIEWFEDLLLGNANEGSNERDMDAAMKALAIRAESITEQCSRAQQDGMPEDAAVELRIALEASPQTMLPELKRAVFPQVSIQAKRWLENSGFGGSTPTPQSTVIKSQNIDLKLVEMWSRRFSPLGEGDRVDIDLEAVGKDIKQMISVVKRDRNNARVTGDDVLIPLLVDGESGIGLYLFGEGWFRGHENSLSERERATLAENRCIPALLVETGAARRFEAFTELTSPETGSAAPNRLRHDIERIVNESCDLLTNVWNGDGIEETLAWYRNAQMSAAGERKSFSLDNYAAPDGTPQRYLRFFER